MTNSHLSNVMAQWQREGIIQKEQQGRDLEIELTDKGLKLVELLKQFDELSKEGLPVVEQW